MTTSAADKFDMASYLRNFVFDARRERSPRDVARRQTVVDLVRVGGSAYPRFVNEFWTPKQRQASSLHEISYRACFKPQLPRFFIERLTRVGDLVYDPFSGRGTTIIEAGLMDRRVVANDINPLSAILSRPRFHIPRVSELQERLDSIPVDHGARADVDLSMFYHPDTLRELLSLRAYLAERRAGSREDDLDAWIRMVATNRLTGHSAGFFSVYTLPPNQAVSPESQIKINAKRRQAPEYRNCKSLIIRKTKQLRGDLTDEHMERMERAGRTALFLNADARRTPEIKARSVQLTVTSPPFLDVVQYAQDNWLRCWFNHIDSDQVAKNIAAARTVENWCETMGQVFRELFRLTRPGGWVAFEVGEIKSGKLKLDEHVVPLGVQAGFSCEGILVNRQQFTKTSNIWGIRNNSSGTNTNRVVIFYKPVISALRSHKLRAVSRS